MRVRKSAIQKHLLTLGAIILLTFLKETSYADPAKSSYNMLQQPESSLGNRVPANSFVDGNSNSNQKFLELVTIGDPVNAPDDQGLGSVDRVYQMSKYEVTARQYAAFLNAVAWKEDTHRLYHPEMGSDKKIACIQQRMNEDGTYRYELIDEQRGDLPITYVSLNDAERFCNWLENGSPGSDQDYEVVQQSTEYGAYNFLQEGNQTIVESNPDAHYHIPSDDEWIKAAYYKGKGLKAQYSLYPTQHNIPPANGVGDISNFANYQTYRGGLGSNFLDHDLKITTVDCFDQTASFYKAHDMGGNVAEWTIRGDGSGLALARGGSWQSGYSWYGSNDLMRTASPKSYDPSTATNFIGFRIAVTVPLPPKVAEQPKIQSTPCILQIANTTEKKNQDRRSELTPEEEALLTAIFITAATLTGSSLLFIAGEVGWNYFIGGMTLEAIQATFTTGRIAMILSHLVFNTSAMVKAEHDINAANTN